MPLTARPLVTSDNYSSIPGVMSWFVGAATLLCTAAKVLTKLMWTGSLGRDDAAIVLSTIFSMGMVASILVETSNGLGRHQDSLSHSELEKWEKVSGHWPDRRSRQQMETDHWGFCQGAFAADLTFITTLFFSKGSVFNILRILVLKHTHEITECATATLTVLWALSGLLVVAFQCKTPDSWAILSRECINQHAFWLCFGIINIVIEIALMLLPLEMIRHIKLDKSKKVILGIMFSTRIFVVGSVIAELYYRQAASRSADRTMGHWPVAVCTLFVQSLSIITACLPYLKPFFASLESGMILIDESRRGGINVTVKQSDSGERSTALGSSRSRQTRSITDGHELTQFSHSDTPRVSPTPIQGTNSLDADSIHSTSRILRSTTIVEVWSPNGRRA